MSYLPLYRALLILIGWSILSPVAVRADLASAVLPLSRSIQVGDTATAFATIINTGNSTATGCDVGLPSPMAATFTFQTTDPATNLLTGTVDTPADIPPGGSQSFVFAITPSAPIAPVDLQLLFDCSNTSPAPVFSGLNTLQFSASVTPVPDIVALGATLQGDGIVRLNSTGVFSVATVNLGAGGNITVSAETGAVALPVEIALCETDPATAACISAVGRTVTTQINTNATPTFGVFPTGSGDIPFDPANNRINVLYHDQTGRLVGATSVAVRSSGQAQVTVRTVLGAADGPVSEGVTITVGDIEKGVTGEDGTLTFTVDAGTVELSAFEPGLAGASQLLALAAGDNVTVDLVLESKGLRASTTLTIAEGQGRVLPMDFQSFELKFVRSDGSRVDLTDLDQADIEHPQGGPPTDLMQFLVLQEDGRVMATDLEGLRTTLLTPPGEIEISAHGDGDDGRTHGASTKLHVGRYTMTGTLAAPPSNPDLSLAGVTVRLTFLSLGEDIVFETTTDAQGAFTVGYIPLGPVQLETTTEDNGQFYNGGATLSMDNDKTVTLTMLTTEDVINGVPSLESRITPPGATPLAVRPGRLEVYSSASAQAAAETCTTIDYYRVFGGTPDIVLSGDDPAYPLIEWILPDGIYATSLAVLDDQTSETLYAIEAVEGALPGRIIRYGDYSLPNTRRPPFFDDPVVAPPLEINHWHYLVEVDATQGPGFIDGFEMTGTKPCDDQPTPIPTSQGDVSVSATGGEKDQRITDSATLTVPATTEVITLLYAVSSGEYPTYVNQQGSQFDDSWEIKVTAPQGELLFAQSVPVNSQLKDPPQWQEGGTTGLLTEDLNVAGSIATDTPITVSVASTNVGDGFLPTTISAVLSFKPPPFNISQVIPDVSRPVPASSNTTKVKVTKGDSTYYSIPRLGQTNTFQRSFTLKLTGRPQGVPISNVTVDLRPNFQTTASNTIISQAPDGIVVTDVDKNTLRVVVTPGNGSVVTDPPEFHKLRYGFTVELDPAALPENFPEKTKAEKDSNPKNALWRMPEPYLVSDRPGGRDSGYDDWAAKGAYEWMQQSDVAAVLTKINDISGEHALNLGHDSHRRGTDIDMYHFTNLLDGRVNGTENYLALRKLVVDQLDCVPQKPDHPCHTDKVFVADWITAARSNIDTLTSMDTVSRIIFGKGCLQSTKENAKFKCSESPLTEYWVKELMTKGKTTEKGGTDELDLGIGAWSNSMVRYWSDHNDHVHIKLNELKLNNKP